VVEGRCVAHLRPSQVTTGLRRWTTGHVALHRRGWSARSHGPCPRLPAASGRVVVRGGAGENEAAGVVTDAG